MALYDRIDVVERGNWEPAPDKHYMPGDCVVFKGVRYIALRESAGIMPTSTIYWRPESEYETPYGVAVRMMNLPQDLLNPGVLSGLAVTAQTEADLTVAVAEGVVYSPSHDRLEIDAIKSLAIPVSDDVALICIVYVDENGAVQVLPDFGDPAVPGSKDFTVAKNAVATDTVTIGGVQFTAVSGTPTANQFKPGANAAATAAALAAAIEANSTISDVYEVTVAGAVITLTEIAAGGGDTPADATYAGTVEITNGEGVTSAAPVAAEVAPATPEGGTLLAEIGVGKSAEAIATEDITDKRTAVTLKISVAAAE